MNQFNIFFVSTYTRFTALLFILILCTSARNVDGSPNYPYKNDGESNNVLIADNFILLKDGSIGVDSPLSGSDYDASYGTIRLIPFKKRTIPIELQKALYAHGIVGRRR